MFSPYRSLSNLGNYDSSGDKIELLATYLHASLSLSILSFGISIVDMSRPFLGPGGVRNNPATPQAKRGRGQGTPIEHNAAHESHVSTVGVKRPGYGISGKKIQIRANYFRTTIPDHVIHHYDGWFFRYSFRFIKLISCHSWYVNIYAYIWLSRSSDCRSYHPK